MTSGHWLRSVSAFANCRILSIQQVIYQPTNRFHEVTRSFLIGLEVLTSIVNVVCNILTMHSNV